ncbi:hypothetical protein FGB62_117g047 [Gracilaria domingensis]|nr:hypothetical protein FGB62_117g047 [Gracilaria domingensis]
MPSVWNFGVCLFFAPWEWNRPAADAYCGCIRDSPGPPRVFLQDSHLPPRDNTTLTAPLSRPTEGRPPSRLPQAQPLKTRDFADADFADARPIFSLRADFIPSSRHAVVPSKGVTQVRGGSAAFHTYPLRYRNPAAPHANAPAARRVNTGRHAEKDNANRSDEGHLRWPKRAVQREHKQNRERHQHAVFKKSLTTHRRRSAKFAAPFAAHNGRNLAKNCRRCYSR